MDKVKWNIVMVVIMKVNGIMIKSKAGVYLNLKMVKFIKASLKMDSFMVMENIYLHNLKS